MILYSGFIFFFYVLLIGIVLTVSSDSWFGAWCGLELNLIAFIPLIALKKNMYSSEASLKYFLIQALGSAFIVLGSITFLIFPVSYVMTMALLLKLGAAPLHFWFPQVMEGLSWFQCIILITLQKFAPIYLLSYLILDLGKNYIIHLRVIFSAVVGALGGINQMLLRKVIAFSSINHISWMLFSLLLGETYWLLYFSFYAAISTSVVLIFQSQQIFHFLQLFNFNSPVRGVFIFIPLLSLGGLPPF